MTTVLDVWSFTAEAGFVDLEGKFEGSVMDPFQLNRRGGVAYIITTVITFTQIK